MCFLVDNFIIIPCDKYFNVYCKIIYLILINYLLIFSEKQIYSRSFQAVSAAYKQKSPAKIEKMLYGNALLEMAYLETYQAVKNEKYADVPPGRFFSYTAATAKSLSPAPGHNRYLLLYG